MLGLGRSKASDAHAVLQALSRSLAIIEFKPDGTILTANENFCAAMGYALDDIKGRHHSIFVDPAFRQDPEYRAFWERLGRGEYESKEYKRIDKAGRDVWIQATYNPVFDAKHRVLKVVKVAAVTTADKLRNAEFEGKLKAIALVQAVIEFTTDGEVLTANDNFLKLLGYRLDEVVGQHHRMFVDPAYGRSQDYRQFWEQLKRGEPVSASFKRFGKSGREVWIQASYNPIYDLNGQVMKVVKYATDITDLTAIGAGLSRMAARELDQAIEIPFGPTFEKLRSDFNLAHDSLRSTLAQIADGADVIQTGTRELASASDDLSRRTEQQAASLEETAAALEEITATVKRSSEGATVARRVVLAADEDAKRSAVIVRNAVQAMSTIESSAQKIGTIIGVIDEIAFQTNLLALNAGVEAARAGEAGRGFAVVASEVRALAQRSAEAAREIKLLISTSKTQVDEGAKLVNETGQALERIMQQVTEINGVVGEIAVGAHEQARALEEVNAAINQMDKVTQQNAAMVEQSTAASRTLSHESSHLTNLVDQFEIGRASRSESQRAAA